MYRDLSNAQIVELYSNVTKVRIVRSIFGQVEAKAINDKNGDIICEGSADYVAYCMAYKNRLGLPSYCVIENEFNNPIQIQYTITKA